MGQTRTRQRIFGCALGALVAVLAPSLLAQAPVSADQNASLPDYSALSHHELTEIGARWDELGDAERRALLKEVKMRMATQKGADGVLQIRAQRRYGRIVRSSDGRVLRIETKVVQLRPLAPRGSGERSFGVGFERRHGPGAASRKSQEGSASAPARRVNDRN